MIFMHADLTCFNKPFLTFNKKKGITPIISVVLIVVVAIFVVTIFLNWSKLFVNDNLDYVNNKFDEYKDIGNSIYLRSRLVSSKTIVIDNDMPYDFNIVGYKIRSENDRKVLNTVIELDEDVAVTKNNVFSMDLFCIPEADFYLDLYTLDNEILSININTNAYDLNDCALPLSLDVGEDVLSNSSFTKTATTENAISFLWAKISGLGTITFGDVDSNITTISASSDGDYNISLTTTGEGSNTLSDYFILTWDTTPITVNVGEDEEITDEVGSLTRTATVNEAGTYRWSEAVNSGNISFSTTSGLTTTITPSEFGTYTIRLSATDLAGNTSSDSFILTYSSRPVGDGFTRIYNCTDLQNINKDLTVSYSLGNDINCSDTINWNKGNGFIPLGNDGSVFLGSFDGNNYTINNLYINRPEENYVGLFGYARKDGSVIKNLILTNVDITGRDYVGGLLGFVYSTAINNVFVSGKISGHNYSGGILGFASDVEVTNSSSNINLSAGSAVGGICGTCNYVNLTDNYSLGTIAGGDHDIGGLMGYSSSGSITNSYANNKVSGLRDIGGIIGDNGSLKTSVSSSYWNTEQSDLGITSGDGIGLKASDMTQKATYKDWDFVTIWGIDEGKSYPYLLSFESCIPGGIGDGTIRICSCEELQFINKDLTSSYILGKNIDCSDTINWNDKEGFIPLGNDKFKFTGSFDGDNHVLSNLYINRPGEDYIGLFGSVSNAKSNMIKNLKMIDVNIIGSDFTGGISGSSQGMDFNNIFVSGVVTGNGYSGGILGLASDSQIINSGVDVNLFGDNEVGGICGSFNNSELINSYSLGTIIGNGQVIGGLIGHSNYGSIDNSYAANNSIIGNGNIGGLIGINDSGSTKVTLSYWDAELSGIGVTSGDGIGNSTHKMKDLSTYVSWDFARIWGIDDGISYPYLLNFRTK